MNEHTKFCKMCKENKPLTSFYGKGGEFKVGHWCKSCFNKYQSAKAVAKKKMFVRFRGNKCFRCKIKHTGKNTPIFDFHHINAKTKDADWSKMRQWSIDRIRPEINKCMLLCSNCHRMLHNRNSHERR